MHCACTYLVQSKNQERSPGERRVETERADIIYHTVGRGKGQGKIQVPSVERAPDSMEKSAK